MFVMLVVEEGEDASSTTNINKQIDPHTPFMNKQTYIHQNEKLFGL